MDVYELKKATGNITNEERASIFVDGYRDLVRGVRAVLLLASPAIAIYYIITALSGHGSSWLGFVPIGLWFIAWLLKDKDD